MPIYAYKCESCGHRQDVLQKVSDPVLGACPACGANTFAKQLTAAGFQLKGSGWYATDFRGGKAPAPDDKGEDKTADKTAEKAVKTDSDTSTKPATPAKAPAASTDSAPAANKSRPPKSGSE